MSASSRSRDEHPDGHTQSGAGSRPCCLVTGEVTDYRRRPFALLAEAEGLEVLAFGQGDERIGALTVRGTSQRGAARLAGSGRYRAVICGLGGRVALPGSYRAARRAGIPFVLWASIWAHPRTPAHALSYLPTRRLYRRADAVVTYGPHVSDHVAAARGRDNLFEAPQAVSAELFGRPIDPAARAQARADAGVEESEPLLLFVGRLEREKGVRVLLEAFAQTGEGRLAVVGEGPLRGEVERAGARVRALGRVHREELPALYAAADALVLPSIPTATFREPWGLVANEAMLQATPVIATDAVGAAAGGLVSHGRNGLVVPAGESAALAGAIGTLLGDPGLRERLGVAARADVADFSEEAWATGVSRALAAVGATRSARASTLRACHQ